MKSKPNQAHVSLQATLLGITLLCVLVALTVSSDHTVKLIVGWVVAANILGLIVGLLVTHLFGVPRDGGYRQPQQPRDDAYFDRSSQHSVVMPPSGKDEDNSLVRFAAFEHEYEAVLLKNNLSDNGIPAWVTGGDGVNTFGAGLTAAGLVGVDVNIRKRDLKAARLVLAEANEDFPPVQIPAWRCNCGEEVDEGFAVCWSCGSECEIQLEN